MTLYRAGPETLVNSTIADNQSNPEIAVLADGGWIVTWTSRSQDGSGAGVYQQRYDKDGRKVSVETSVNAIVDFDQTHASVAALPNGGWVVTWSSADQNGITNVYHQHYDAAGNKLWAADKSVVPSNTTNARIQPAITSLQDGGWVVAWASTDGALDGSFDVHQQWFDSNGNPRFAIDSVVNARISGNQDGPSLISLKDSGWVVAWQSAARGAEGIFYRRFDAGGEPVSDADTLVQAPNGFRVFHSKLGSLPHGGWIVTWLSRDGLEIYQQQYRQDGTAVWPAAQRVNAIVATYDANLDVTVLPDGGWVVTWRGAGSASSGHQGGIYQRHYDPDGQPTSAIEQLVKDGADFSQFQPSISALPDGSWIVTWASSDGSQLDIHQQRFQPNQAPTGISLVAPAPIAEASAIGTQVGTLQGSDINLGFGDSLTYTLLDDGGGRFALDGGRLLVADGLRLDYEQAASHTIRARATDRDGLSVEQDLAVQVGDVANEAVIGSAGVDHLAGGAGNDRFQGLDGDDLLAGGAGNDTLDGGLGADRLDGGTGNDTYLIDNADDVVTETAGGGSDVVQTSVSYTLAAGAEVEFLTALGAGQVNLTGNEYANMLTGNGAANILKGEAGHDTLDGGVGADTLEGGLGSDVYLVDNAGDVILEAVGGGSDAIRTGIG
jgi:Ca2+-binding RTX toxin-like protein